MQKEFLKYSAQGGAEQRRKLGRQRGNTMCSDMCWVGDAMVVVPYLAVEKILSGSYK